MFFPKFKLRDRCKTPTSDVHLVQTEQLNFWNTLGITSITLFVKPEVADTFTVGELYPIETILS